MNTKKFTIVLATILFTCISFSSYSQNKDEENRPEGSIGVTVTQDPANEEHHRSLFFDVDISLYYYANNLYFSFEGNSSDVLIEVFNATNGKYMSSFVPSNTSSATLNISKMSSGTYFIVMTFENNIVFRGNLVL